MKGDIIHIYMYIYPHKYTDAYIHTQIVNVLKNDTMELRKKDFI